MVRESRRRCQERLDELELPAPFSVEKFAEAVSRGRGRPITLRPMPGGGGLLGLWIAGPWEDVIFYQGDTSVFHQQHIVLHELSHILLGHSANTVPELLQALCPDLAPDMVKTVLARSSYDDLQEQEAELLATLIFDRARFALRGFSGRLESSLGDVVSL